ncbi:collagen alpha-1(XVIII) chain-like [Mustela nigripes]|uniref:collagen alpha-1(XVIII) chain-like n=1 Tax=Mustela nigripes TaxID=77151 RepID=UPI0028159923|nr:collagen alpha-1(XVIII) chain-like [Mustela nigripes]
MRRDGHTHRDPETLEGMGPRWGPQEGETWSHSLKFRSPGAAAPRRVPVRVRAPRIPALPLSPRNLGPLAPPPSQAPPGTAQAPPPGAPGSGWPGPRQAPQLEAGGSSGLRVAGGTWTRGPPGPTWLTFLPQASLGRQRTQHRDPEVPAYLRLHVLSKSHDGERAAVISCMSQLPRGHSEQAWDLIFSHLRFRNSPAGWDWAAPDFLPEPQGFLKPSLSLSCPRSTQLNAHGVAAQ